MLVALLVGAASLLVPVTPAAAVVGGSPVTSGEFPFVVALVEPGWSAADSQFCGGTLIAPDWVLTAAHCVTHPRDGRPERVDRIEVLVGRDDLTRKRGERIGIDEIVIHPERFDPELDIDIALLHLVRAAPVPVVATTGPNDRAPTRAGTPATVVGWGVTARGGNRVIDDADASDTLLAATLPIVGNQACADMTGADSVGADAFELCAGDLVVGGTDACSGDSGGPLLVATPFGWIQVGVVAWGDRGCGLPDSPGVYTRVGAAAEWIAAVTSA